MSDYSLLDSTRSELQDEILNLNANLRFSPSWETFQRKAGKIEGLQMALDIIQNKINPGESNVASA